MERVKIMKQVFELMQQYEYVGMAILLLVQMIMMVVMIKMVKKLQRYMESITGKVQSYLNIVLAEDEEDNADKQPENMVSVQEQQMRETLDKKKKQQEEAVFNAILQEIFP